MEAKRSSHVGDTRWCYKYSSVCIFSFLFLRSASFLYFPSTRTFIVSYKDFFPSTAGKSYSQYRILATIHHSRPYLMSTRALLNLAGFLHSNCAAEQRKFWFIHDSIFSTTFLAWTRRELTRFDDLNRNETENKKANAMTFGTRVPKNENEHKKLSCKE